MSETGRVSVQWHSIYLLYSAYQSGGMGKKLFQTLVVLHQILLNLFTEASRANCSGSVSHHSWYSSFGSHRTWMQCPKWGREVPVILSAVLTAHLTFMDRMLLVSKAVKMGGDRWDTFICHNASQVLWHSQTRWGCLKCVPPETWCCEWHPQLCCWWIERKS